jgi:hypothetical protein
MNWRCIKSDLREARDQITDIITKIENGDEPTEADYLIELQHAFHHLNIAWNARQATLEKYVDMSTRDFNRWRKFPNGTEWKELHRTKP